MRMAKYRTISAEIAKQGSIMLGSPTIMKLNHYAETDSLYIDLIDAPSADSEEVRPSIVLDFNTTGQFVGIDVQNVSQHTNLTQLDIAYLPTKFSAKAI